MENKRIIYLDNVKCFAIILVMIGHALQYLSGDNFKGNIPFNVIYSFHMPLFMIVCGYFFSSSLKLSTVDFLFKKTIALLLPAFCWCFIKLILNRGNQMLNILYDSFWFLKSAFLCYLICYFAVKVFRKEWIAYALLVLLSLSINLHSEPFMLNYMLPSFIVGILIHDKRGWIMSKRLYILITTLALYACLLPFWKFEYFIGNTPFADTDLYQQMLIISYRLLIGIAGSIMIIMSFSYFNKTNKHIAFIGCSTLSFYVMNGLFSDVQRHILHLNISNQILCLAAALVLVAIQVPCFYIITHYFKKYRITRFFLLGINK